MTGGVLVLFWLTDGNKRMSVGEGGGGGKKETQKRNNR